ncbi:MAG: UbiA family prenyltransferase [Verrucomicrobia bacterium]|nr:UbiA family prenyltransferase [Verrucomicrobiota bacterium]
MAFSGKIRPLLASARVANLPTVVSNVWLGVAVAGWIGTFHGRNPPILTAAAWLIPAGAALYLGGNLLNDWKDREWDARHRPERALPAGVFLPTSYLLAGIALLAAGIGLALAFHPLSATAAAMIALAVVGYTAWHKRHPASVALVAVCRALLPLLALAPLAATHSGFPAILALPSLAIFLHVAGLSARARHESADHHRGSPTPAVAALVSAGPLMAACVFLLAPDHPAIILPALAVWAVWTLRAIARFSASPGKQVSALLAGIPLLDWVLLLPLGAAMALFARIQPVITVRGPGSAMDVIPNFAVLGGPGIASLLLPPLAFLTSLALQRLSPAT